MGEVSSSNINPFALLLLLAMVFIALVASRQAAVKALFVVAAFIPLGQQFNIFGLHFHFFRVMILAGWIRVLSRGEIKGFTMNKLDKLFLAWALVGLVCGTLRKPTAETFGVVYNSLGAYFLFRFLISQPTDMFEHLRFLALVVFFIGIGMVPEYLTHKSPFAILGGVPDVLQERGDRVRCQGPFRIAILAGTFSATLFPLMVGLWFQDPQRRMRAILGIIGSVVVTVLSNSSGPLLCLIAAVIGLAMWKMRNRMSLFRRCLVATIILLALVMKAPVWYVLAKASDLIGGGGWHRSFVIDVFIRNFADWWMMGYSYTAKWVGDYTTLLVDPNNMDITNHYVAQGVMGGIWMFALFIAILVICFKIIGRCVDQGENGLVKPIFFWSLGAALASHCAAFFSISYFDQIQIFWFWLLAVLSGLLTYTHAYGDQSLLVTVAPDDKTVEAAWTENEGRLTDHSA
jgi:hypothetical protein